MLRLKQSEIIQSLSIERLQPYMTASRNMAEALKNYQSNIRLSQALYPIMQQLEVVLRNQLEIVLIQDYGQQWFYDTVFQNRLDPIAQRKLIDVIQSLQRKNSRITSSMVVAELTFGYWTTLLDQRYDQFIWIPHNKTLFPFATANQRHVRQIRQKLDDIRRLRNRIAHYEIIWKDTLFLNKYQSIKQLLTWMNPHAALWLERCRLDQFSKVHSSIFGKTP